MIEKITVNEIRGALKKLKAGQQILLSGTVYTARDAAHKRLIACLEKGEEPPFPLRDAAIYYAGQAGLPEGRVIGACGPTTSGRMDPFTPTLIQAGVVCHIGKGDRSKEVYDAMKTHGGVYLLALGGIGALAAKYITKNTPVAYHDLGCESIKELTFTDFPLYIGIDTFGNTMF